MKTVEALNMLKSGIYVYGYLHTDTGERKIDVSEGEVLLQNDYIRLCKAAKVTIKPLLNMKHILDFQEAKWLVEKVGKPPRVKLFQYRFLLLPLQLIEKLERAELYRIENRPTGMILVNVAHLFYSVYISRSGRVYSETEGGVKAYSLLKKGEIRWPQVYVWHGGHHVEIGLRIPLDTEQVHQLFSYLLSC